MQKKKKRLVWGVGIGLLFFVGKVHAVEVEYYLKNASFFKTNNIVSDIFRWIGWWIIKGLRLLADAAQELYDTMFSFLDFTTWGKFGSFLESFQPVLVALMCLSILAFGILLMMTQKKEIKFIQNLVLAIFIFTSSTLVFTSLNQMVTLGKNAVIGKQEKTSVKIIENNMWSLADIDQKIGLKNLNAKSKKNQDHPHLEGLSGEDLDQLDPTQTQNFNSEILSDPDSKGQEGILGKRIHFYGGVEHGKYEIIDVKNGYGWNSSEDEDFGNTFYYRFKIGWFSILTELLSLVVVYFCLSYKAFRIVWEITFGRVLAYFYATELSGGQKIVKILVGIRDNYITLFFTAIMIKVYELMTDFISGVLGDKIIVKGIVILFLAFCTMDGPNLIEKLTGVDAGLKSGWGKLVAGLAMMRGLSSLSMTPKSVADKKRQRSLWKAQGAYYRGLSQGFSNKDSGGSRTSAGGSTSGTSEKNHSPAKGAAGGSGSPSFGTGNGGNGGSSGSSSYQGTNFDASDTSPPGETLGSAKNERALNGYDVEGKTSMYTMKQELGGKKKPISGSSGVKPPKSIFKKR